MIKILRTFLWILPFSGFLIGYLVPTWFISLKPQKTPTVVGKTLQDALGILSYEHLNARLIKEQEDAIIPAGTVIHQIPSSNQPVKADQTVSMVISKRPALAITPDLLNKKPLDFSAVTKKSTASIECITIPSAYKSSSCLAQVPLANSPLTSKTIFAYFSSEKKSLFIMPNFINTSLEWVNEYLTSIPIVFQAYSNGIPVADPSINNNLNVISQRPLAGSIIDLIKPPFIQLEVE